MFNYKVVGAMTLLQVSDQSDYEVLRQLVQTIARTSSPETSLATLLENAIQITTAVGAGLVIFKEQNLIITAQLDAPAELSDRALRELADYVQALYQINPPATAGLVPDGVPWLAAPVRMDKELLGLLWLVFDSGPALTTREQETLAALLDGMAIVGRSVLLHAIQDKLCRNQGEFIHLVSHDLRSPLTSIKGFAGMLESGMVGELNEQQMYYVEKILSGVEQMTSLVDRIQDAGRFDPQTGFYEMERVPCGLIGMTERIVQSHLLPAEKQELSIACTINGDVPIVNVDSTMLERAITNLIDNAIKYTPNGGHIVVDLQRRDENIVLSVADDGYGISDQHQTLLFERHVRLKRREHKRVKGTGLGLFIVRSVARRHGGEAWVESVEGEGSTFYIRIPLMGENLFLEDQPDT
jgi:signal transduction histidine kinase